MVVKPGRMNGRCSTANGVRVSPLPVVAISAPALMAGWEKSSPGLPAASQTRQPRRAPALCPPQECPTDAPDGAEAGVVHADQVAAGVEVGGLDHDEPGGRPAVHEGLVTVHRPGVAVREHDDGQVLTVGGGGDFHLQVDATAGGGHGDGLDSNELAVERCTKHGVFFRKVLRLCHD
jgi:hypothetical protein